MNHKIFSVYDSAAELYQRPFVAHNTKTAVRAFKDISVAADSEYAKHPHDYTLMELGEFNDASGEIKPTTPRKVITALEAQASGRNIENGELQKFDETVSPGGTA